MASDRRLALAIAQIRAARTVAGHDRAFGLTDPVLELVRERWRDDDETLARALLELEANK